MRPSWVLALLLMGVSIATGCARDERPNIVLVTLDTTRADRIGAYGDTDARTPVLDHLAAQGTLFERAYSPVPLTLPSHTTILTGLAPSAHGVHDNNRFIVPDSLDTLAERLKAHGYATAAFVSAVVLKSTFGLDQGFDVYSDDTHETNDPLSFLVPQRPAEETTDDALAWLATERSSAFFLWTHYYDPHAPREPRPPYDEIEDTYAAEIAYMDAQLGRLLAGVAGASGGRETVILVVADHGESLGEHHEPSHGIVAYDATLRVPLIVVGPGFEPGARSTEFVATEDVTPTLLAVVGAEPVTNSTGAPLQNRPLGEEPAERFSMFESLGPSYGLGWAPLAGVRSARWKFTAEPEPTELYDVLADPEETRNLVDEHSDVAARFAARYREGKEDLSASAPETPSLDPAMQAQLEALGYVSVPQEFASGKIPDPRKAVAALAWVRRAKGLLRSGRVADGIEALTLLTQEPSVGGVALRDLAVFYTVTGRTARALEATRALFALHGSTDVRIRLANLLLAEGHADESLAVLDEGTSLQDGEQSAVGLARGRALMELGQYAEAEQAALAVLARDPAPNDRALALRSQARAAQGHEKEEIETLVALLAAPPTGVEALPETRLLLAGLLRRDGRDPDAVRVLEANAPPTPAQSRMLADIALARGDGTRAVGLYEELLERAPMADDVRRTLAELYDSLGRSEEAVAFYDALILVDPEDATLRVDRGTSFFRLGQRAAAEQDFRDAIAIDEAIPEAHLNLALLLLGSGQEAEAETELTRSLALRPEFAKAHFHLAGLYRRRGDPRAAEHAEQATRLSGQMSKGMRVLPPVNKEEESGFSDPAHAEDQRSDPNS
jgi:arylsulfatase A-like enzyme/Flp pilus assembly protein TadD